ncbi:MAG TPA: AraC family transcriptional regulator [Symbiobacteriaceae bacterium]|nr:AraC family transcriptional regulator [Symbiobacteriaceae bacterium]
MAHEAQVTAAIAYIEAHLKEPFSLRDLAQAAGYSPFHFHRLFLAITGETPAAFIRRRRLTESARELAEPGKRALDVALAYQYDSQEAFIRAFRRHFGVTPGRYRRYDNAPRQPGKPPQPIVPGGSFMEPRIVEQGPFTLIGMIYFGENQKGEIPQLWNDFIPRIDKIPDAQPGASYGFCFMDDRSNPNFWYMASVPVAKIGDIPAEMVAKTVPAHTYAVFTHRGALAGLGETYAVAYKTWLPASGYELAASFDFELYDRRFNPADEANSELDIYLPIRPKA